MRGPRGGIILTNDEALAKKFDWSVPGIQGGPLMHVIAGKAVAFGECLQPDFKTYVQNVIDNAKAMGEVLVNSGFALVSGGTDSHLILVDLRPKGLTGNISEKALGRAHITCNKNGVPFNPAKPMVTSGIRLGSPAGTTRGFGVAEFREVGRMIAEVLEGLQRRGGQRRRGREDQGRSYGSLPPLPDLRLIGRSLAILGAGRSIIRPALRAYGGIGGRGGCAEQTMAPGVLGVRIVHRFRGPARCVAPTAAQKIRA